MTKISAIAIAIVCLTLLNCKEEEHSFRTEKRFWSVEDYKSANLELNYGYESDEKLPSFDDPSTRIIVEKLIDQQNYKIVLEDDELGLKHRNRVAEQFFRQWKDMMNIYRARDLKDNYIYDQEFLGVYHFGLGLQLRYFKLGNDEIVNSSDDPNSKITKNDINSNIETLIDNFSFYLDLINDENDFSEKGKVILAQGIDKYFTQLITLYPNGNYTLMAKKINLMLEKSNTPKIKYALTRLNSLIASKKHQE